ncbi:hypothetical protein JHK86_043439 [Glycine max]|nr:hypothetical protein JHK86_043439 [Glycine max]
MAAEMVAGALVSTFVQKTIDSLASRFVDYFRGRKLNKKLLSKIKVKLLAIDVLADDAELKQFRDARVRDWLFMAKDVVFEAEDLLADIDYELSKCQVEAESQPILNQVSNFFRPSSLSSFDKEIESRMEQILDDLDDLESRGGYLGLTRTSGVGVGSGSGSKVLEKLPSASSVVESDIYGRDDDKKLILDWITSDTDEKLSILSIVGMGGLGKTTLAQLVYNDPRIVSKFDVKAWICVSEEFDVFNVSRAILDTITDSTDHGRELEIVQRRLKENLADKKFLLVLDDIWNESRLKWEAVQNALVCGAQGSKILVTTRSEEVASTMRSKEHKLEQLQEDYCWQLFAKHAFRDDNLPRDPVCPEIGRKIVKKCKGLPLALKSMGSLLHNKPFAREWESVLQSEIWELKDSGIVPALALSYHHLPPHLKTCFAYCALFPKDYLIDKECLIQLWMAENFLHCHQGSKSPEEVGQQYFNDLLSRSFFQQSSIFEGFVMHDLLNDLAKYVCGDIYFRLRVDQAKCTQKTTRHFSVSMITERYFDEFGTSCDTKKLRTFMPTSWRMNEHYSSWNCKMSIHELFSKLKFLRVLSLSHCLDIKELPDSVCNFKHLRWLDLSHTDIEKLPESTCSLYNLQILKLNDCRYLRELPSNLHELTNLHRLEFVNTEIIKVPPHLGKLKNLQVSMSSFHVGKRSEFTIQKFGELNLLHERLSFRELQNIENPSDALAADLKNKTHLVELEFEWNSHRNPDDSAKERDVIVIENLQPSKHLKELSIINYGGKQFPNWLSDNSLSNVVSLELNNCQSCQHLPSLGLLPFLKNLKISSLDGIVSIGADFHGNSTSSFPSLERLKFSSMKAWKKWECEAVTGAFPCLQYLSIKKCPKLKGLPSLGLLPFLKNLEISRLDGIVSIGADFHGNSSSSFPSLETLKFSSMKAWEKWECEAVTGAFPCLQYLYIGKCPKLKGDLPEQLLPLKKLEISECKQLEASAPWALELYLKDFGGALLSAFLRVAFEKLASPQILDFFSGRKLDQKLLNNLEIKLNSIQVLADDAELKQFRDPHLRNWLLKVKDAVLDTEDLLDEIQYEISKCQVEVQPQSESQTCTCKVPNFFKSSPVSSFNKEINSSMKNVLDDLDDLASRMDNLGLKKPSDLVVGSGSGGKVPQSTSLVVESDICGRDGDKEMIINWLTSNTDNKLSILSIVGMGGLGKTTLAQLVYNDPRIENNGFVVKAWICVSKEFDVFNVSRRILDTITDSTDHGRELEIVQRRLKERLADKKFLLVLDDVWNESRPEWEAVQNVLVCGAQGSRILVTTRSHKVASTMRSEQHHLQQLQEDYCWKLFAKHAFGGGNPQLHPECNEIAMKIVEKCRGLPLALKSMGSLLHNKSFVLDWENILKSEIWEIEDSGIVPALALSYHHLPLHLKTCFAYCALFPKGYVFDRECLIQLWIAENFLNCHQGSKSPEEIGQQYFNDLLSRSFFQQSSEYEYEEAYVMHDLLNDLAKYICGDIYFRLEVDREKSTQKTTRHFSFSVITKRYFNEFGTSCDTKKLRTFMPTSRRMNETYWSWNCKMSIHELFSKLKFLRVLSLSHCLDIKELPDSVCNFKHLRSIDLSHTDIEKLPESTCSLYNLQILKLNDCRSLKELPSNLHELTNLHRLEFVDTDIIKVPPHLGKLKNLQVSMSSFHVGKRSEFTTQQLGELNLLGRLSFRELQNIENPSDALAADLKNKTRLVELKLEWISGWNPDDSAKERDVIVIENLQPSKHLEKLSIRNYGGKQFPNWLSNNSLSNVVSLELDNCQSCQHLPSLGLLPFLKNLEISSLDGIVSIGADFHGNSTSSFPSLERLKFSSMKAWEKWECEAVRGAFPCLRYLSISKCPKLKGDLPEQLLPLKRLQISECKQLEASAPRAPRALELELQDFGKLQLDWATLKKLSMGGHSMEALLLEKSDTLEELEIFCCPLLSEMFVIFCNCRMRDYGCDSLKTFPLDFFPTLRTLHLSGFRNLQMITQDHTHNHLEFLKIRKCPQLESLPGSMHMQLPSLKELRIDDCPRVESFPEGGLPSNLKEMRLYKCSSGLMASLKGALGDNPSLETLSIRELDAESFPDEGLLPLSLTCLTISGFRNLKKLDYKGLCQLSSLKKLILENCPNLQQLPEEGLPRSISYFTIGYSCPKLKQRCQNPGGEDWPKIAHIPTLHISTG